MHSGKRLVFVFVRIGTENGEKDTVFDFYYCTAIWNPFHNDSEI